MTDRLYGDLFSPGTIKLIYIFTDIAWHFLPILIKFGICGQTSIKVPNIKFHVGSRASICRETDGQTNGLTAWYNFSWKQRFYSCLTLANKSKTYLCLHVKCTIFTRFGLSWEIFMKVSNIIFQENPSSMNGTNTCGQKDGRSARLTETITDMTKVTDALRDCAKTPNNGWVCALNVTTCYLYHNNQLDLKNFRSSQVADNF
jgi:hypothetical protein